MTTQTRKRAQCSACGMSFEYDWKELAKHIAGKKRQGAPREPEVGR